MVLSNMSKTDIFCFYHNEMTQGYCVLINLDNVDPSLTLHHLDMRGLE